MEKNLAFDILSELKGLSPRLRRIELWGIYLDRTILPKVINCFPELTHIFISGSHVGGKFFRALEDRFSQLTCLDLYDCRGIQYWMSSLILFSCPRLVRFISPLLTTVDFPRPPQPSQSAILEAPRSRQFWACSGLKRLEADLFLWSHNLEWNARVMEQLMAQKNLEVLIIRHLSFDQSFLRDGAVSTESSGPRWSQGQFTRAQLKQQDALTWMVEAWPKLQHFWYSYPSGQQMPR